MSARQRLAGEPSSDECETIVSHHSVERSVRVPVTVRDLAHRTAEVLRSVQQDRRRILVTSNGRPVAALVPIDEDELFDQALEAYLPSEEQISREILAGETESLASIVEELGL